MNPEMEKEVDVVVEGDRKVTLEIPDDVMAGPLQVRSKMSIGELFKFLSEKESGFPDGVLGIGANSKTKVQTKPLQ